MRNWYFIILALFIIACAGEKSQTVNEEVANESNENTSTAPPVIEESESTPEEILAETELLDLAPGFYVGSFRAEGYDEDKDYSRYNKINISVDSFGGAILYGHSVVAGNSRPFSGPFQIEGNSILAKVKEPGDDRYDGEFDFELRPTEEKMFGQWNAYDKNLAVFQRRYDLEKQEYSYQPDLTLPESVEWAELYTRYDGLADGGEFLTEDVLSRNPSTELLTKEDVENMYRGDLEIMRNTIYARHGYSFKNRKVRFLFDRHVDWYIPVSTDIRAKLTTLEKANIELIKRYEEHAERYYDDYGR